MTSDLPAISLFSGGGGLDLGAAYAGFSTRVTVEWEKYACEALRRVKSLEQEVSPGHRYLANANILEADVRELSTKDILEAARLEVGEPALVIGGPPCVTFSVAGERAGLQHDIGMLYMDFVRVVRETRPKAFIFENVKGLMTAPGTDGERGGALADIRRELAGTGYALTERLVDAADYGVPQHRHRLFIIGHRDGPAFEFPGPTHADPTMLSQVAWLDEREPWRTVRDAISDLPSAVPTGAVPAAPNHTARSHSPEVVASLAATPPGKRNPMYKRDRLLWDAPAKAVRAQGKLKRNGTGQKNSSHQSIHPDEHRQITVRESARLQTFPDWYEFDSTFVNGYRVVGDAVPPRLAYVIARSLREQAFPGDMRGQGVGLDPGTREVA